MLTSRHQRLSYPCAGHWDGFAMRCVVLQRGGARHPRSTFLLLLLLGSSVMFNYRLFQILSGFVRGPNPGTTEVHRAARQGCITDFVCQLVGEVQGRESDVRLFVGAACILRQHGFGECMFSSRTTPAMTQLGSGGRASASVAWRSASSKDLPLQHLRAAEQHLAAVERWLRGQGPGPP